MGCFFVFFFIRADSDCRTVWLAPEVLANGQYTAASDMYSLGLIFWELVTASGPYDEYRFPFTHMLEAAIVAGLRPSLPAEAPAPFAALVRSMLAAEPADRPSADRVLNQLEALVRSLLGPKEANFICNYDWI
jgi:eukaryotic-like serine/threonine-protein kinase